MIDIGKTILLGGNRKFFCFDRIQLDGKDYVYLIAADESGEIEFAEQEMENGEPMIHTIGSKAEKIKLVKAFQEKHQKDWN